jgi:hypothetical protein
MKYPKQDTIKKEVHYWIRQWTPDEYRQNTRELFVIGDEYKKCQKIADENKERKPRLFASDYYQIQNKGMTENGSRMHDTSLENQMYEVNQAKIDKYLAWKYFNRTTDEIELDKIQYTERVKNILDMLKKLSATTQ